MVLCRQLGEAQQRCSAAVAAQAAEIDALRSEVVRLRGALVVRGTQLAMAREALEQAHAATPGLLRRRAMAQHIRALAERIATLTRECLRWRLAAQQGPVQSPLPLQAPAQSPLPSTVPFALQAVPSAAHPLQDSVSALDASLAAADLVICQTGCISHDDYWRVQDHCRRTGKPCILVDQPLAALQPVAVLRMSGLQRHGQVAGAPESVVFLNKMGSSA